MRKFTAIIAASLALGAWSQTKVAVQSKPSLQVPRFEKGVVEGNTYKNPSIGLEFTPAPGLQLQNPELKGTPGTGSQFVTVSAWGEQKLFSAREGTIVYAEALARYPEGQRSTDAYMGRVVSANKQNGFEAARAELAIKFGGVEFARTDFKKGVVYEAVLVKACDAQAYVFIITGSSRDAVENLIAATNLKLDLRSSGCGSKTVSAPK